MEEGFPVLGLDMRGLMHEIVIDVTVLGLRPIRGFSIVQRTWARLFGRTFFGPGSLERSV